MGQRGCCLDGLRQRHAVHFRHVHVRQDDVWQGAVSGGLRHQSQGSGVRRRTAHLHTPKLKLAREDTHVGNVIIHNQRPPAVQRSGINCAPDGRRLGARHRDGEPERRALARHTFHANPAAHQLNQPLADGQAQSRASIFTGGRRVQLREGLE